MEIPTNILTFHFIAGEAYYPYPLVVEQSDGHKVYIVQASAYTKYIGDFVVYFDENGEIQNFSGNPIYLDSGVIPGT